MSSKDFKKLIVDKLSDILKERGFKKKGNTFVLSNGDLSYYIILQSSQSTTKDILKVSVNIEMASAVISQLDDASIPAHLQRHYNRRIGNYLDTIEDKWWTMESPASAETAAQEIAAIIEAKVLPDLDNFKSTNDLADLWKAGTCPGLTEGQRKHYLNLIERGSWK